MCPSGCDEPSEENHLAWRRDREASRVPDVDQTEGKTAARRACSVHRLRNVMALLYATFYVGHF